MGGDVVVYAAMGKDTIGAEYYKEGTGSIKSAKWKATLTSYTQEVRAQSLGFKPGTKITVINISKSHTHTLNVVNEIKGPPAIFPPKTLKLSQQAKGDGKFEKGYASGPIKPGKSVTMTLVKSGIYLIGCAFHYSIGMHDVILVGPYAGPGPQATPTPSGHGGGSDSGSGSGSGSGW
jgi:plastocyanin